MQRGQYRHVAETPHGTFKRMNARRFASVSVWQHTDGTLEPHWHVSDKTPAPRRGWVLLGQYGVGTVEQVPWRSYVPQSRSDYAAELEGVL